MRIKEKLGVSCLLSLSIIARRELTATAVKPFDVASNCFMSQVADLGSADNAERIVGGLIRYPVDQFLTISYLSKLFAYLQSLPEM